MTSRKKVGISVVVFMILTYFTMATGCGGGTGSATEEDRLQSSCVASYVPMSRDIPDGQECSNFGYSDCPHALASDCIHYCAFDVCQPSQCLSNSDCAWLGSNYECKEYLVQGDPSYGMWCGYSDCPKGTLGCPCLYNTCSDYAECVDDICQDTCPYGCRQGSVCCGGVFCGGDCIGTPCC